jgi:serine/threonine-protein kinase
MGIHSKKLLTNDVMVEPSAKPWRHKYIQSSAFLRAKLLHLALIATFACLAQPALATKVVVKKGVFGAIALQRDTGQLGYAYNSATSRAAKMEALKQCAHLRCEVVASFSNACGALARGPKKYFPATGATRQEAETKALRLCAAKECEVAAWACTK